MRRIPVPERPGWQARLEALDFPGWRREDGSAYWVEGACIELSEAEVETLHDAAAACESLIQAEVAAAIDDPAWLARLGLDERLAPLAMESWRRGDPSLYGRFDFAWDGAGPPKLLEYNADTPTALYEAAVVQWAWLTDHDPGADQYNAIHERLIEAWAGLAPAVAQAGRLHVTCLQDEIDDSATAAYIEDCARQAGIETCALDISEIGLRGGRLVDAQDRPITHLFKLYPWEWLTAEDEAFAAALVTSEIGVMEPPWRVAAASKGLLVDLWARAPGHPNLLPTFWTPDRLEGDYVSKPILGREGANVRLRFRDRPPTDQPGPFGGQPHVHQARAAMPAFDDRVPVFGVWVVAGEPCGLGVREQASAVTDAGAHFIPHRIAG